jgi:hypothetical protein
MVQTNTVLFAHLLIVSSKTPSMNTINKKDRLMMDVLVCCSLLYFVFDAQWVLICETKRLFQETTPRVIIRHFYQFNII